MKVLHVAIIEDHEECLVSHTESDLRKQVDEWLTKHSLPIPTNEEWAVCILAKEDRDVELVTVPTVLGSITYYKTESRLGAR